MAPDLPHTDRRQDTHALSQVMEPIAETMGFEILLVEWGGSGGSRILRVYLDRLEGNSGVTLVDCAQMSRLFSQGIDAAENSAEIPNLSILLRQPYTLEVSSPGLDRPLVRLEHFQRYVGKRVSIRTWEPLEEGKKQRVFHGVIDSAESEGLETDPQSSEHLNQWVTIKELDRQQQVRFELSQIRRAHLVYEGDG